MAAVREVTVWLTVWCLLAAMPAWWLLLRSARRGRTGLATVLVALGVSGALVLAALVVGGSGPLSQFGVLHLLYLAAVLTVPLVGVGVLAAASRDRPVRPPVVLAGVLLLVPAPLGFYATHVAPFRLQVDHAQLALDPARSGEQPLTVAVLADLQTQRVGDHERAAVDAVMASEPDIVLVPGDLIQEDTDEHDARGEEVRRLLARLDAPGGVWFVHGDVDRTARTAALLRGTGIEVLDDRVVRVEVGDRSVLLGGAGREYDSAGAARVRRELVDAAGADDVTVLVSHRPDAVRLLPARSGIDLTVAGHTHGGQVSVPGIGPLITLSKVPREVAAGGLHEVAGNRIYVSTGVGMERGQAPQLRFGVAPSVGVLRLDDA